MEESRRVSKVTQQLREIEDYNIAYRLQEEEYARHYNHNRQHRQLVANDTKYSMREQATEDALAREQQVKFNRLIAESDEEIARQLQQQFDEEERMHQEELAQKDAELAQRLAVEEDYASD